MLDEARIENVRDQGKESLCSKCNGSFFKTKKKAVLVAGISVIAVIVFLCVFHKLPTKRNQVRVFEALVKRAERQMNGKFILDSLFPADKKYSFLGFVEYPTKNEKARELDEGFIETYLKKHSAGKLVTNTLTLYMANANCKMYGLGKGDSIDSIDWHAISKYDCSCQTWAQFIEMVFENEECKKVINKIKIERDSPGFYQNNLEVDPQPYQKKVPNAGNKTEVGEVVHYGDFAVLTRNIPEYHDGLYKWINGKFYDTESYWRVRTESELYYKGKRIVKMDCDGGILWSGMTFFTLEEKAYYMFKKNVFTGNDNYHSIIVIVELKDYLIN